jgi:hypothetical protein
MELENILTRVTSKSLVKRKKQNSPDEVRELRRAKRNVSVIDNVNEIIKKTVNRAISNLGDRVEYIDEIRITYVRTIEVLGNIPYRSRISFTNSKTPVILNIKYKDEGDLNIYSSF